LSPIVRRRKCIDTFGRKLSVPARRLIRPEKREFRVASEFLSNELTFRIRPLVKTNENNRNHLTSPFVYNDRFGFHRAYGRRVDAPFRSHEIPYTFSPGVFSHFYAFTSTGFRSLHGPGDRGAYTRILSYVDPESKSLVKLFAHDRRTIHAPVHRRL